MVVEDSGYLVPLMLLINLHENRSIDCLDNTHIGNSNIIASMMNMSPYPIPIVHLKTKVRWYNEYEFNLRTNKPK